MNWGELKAAVASWTTRSDLYTDAALFPRLLELAEQAIFRGTARRPGLRLRMMLATTDPFTPGALPFGFLQVERVSIVSNGQRKTLEPLSGDDFTLFELQSGPPDWYTIRGQQLLVAPSPTTPVRLDYYARPGQMLVDSDTNSVIDNYPGIWLYAMLVEAGNWLRDAEMVAQYMPMLDAAIEGAHAEDERARRSLGTPLQIRSIQAVRA